jgi:hypothetical protein
MNNKNGKNNLFSTILPIKYRNIVKNIFLGNSSQNQILHNKVDLQYALPTFQETTMKKTNNEENLSLDYFSGRSNNYNMYKTLLLNNNCNKIKKMNENSNKISLINKKINRNNIHKNFSNSDIQQKKGIIPNINKKVISCQNPDIFKIFLFNKNKNFFSKDNINKIKFRNNKNLN